MKKNISLVLTLLLISTSTHAHLGHKVVGFSEGFKHPVLGFDHLLAMVAVGILSAGLGGRAIWSVPLTFVVVMLIGGVLGMYDISLYFVEIGIALSVFLLGIALVAKNSISPIWGMVFVALFAIFHGHAHGTEMPKLSKPVLYASGFILATALLHVGGVFIGLISKKFKYGSQVLKFLGAIISVIGFYLIF